MDEIQKIPHISSDIQVFFRKGRKKKGRIVSSGFSSVCAKFVVSEAPPSRVCCCPTTSPLENFFCSAPHRLSTPRPIPRCPSCVLPRGAPSSGPPSATLGPGWLPHVFLSQQQELALPNLLSFSSTKASPASRTAGSRRKLAWI